MNGESGKITQCLKCSSPLVDAQECKGNYIVVRQVGVKKLIVRSSICQKQNRYPA